MAPSAGKYMLLESGEKRPANDTMMTRRHFSAPVKTWYGGSGGGVVFSGASSIEKLDRC